jgi:hypothetical protein
MVVVADKEARASSDLADGDFTTDLVTSDSLAPHYPHLKSRPWDTLVAQTSSYALSA